MKLNHVNSCFTYSLFTLYRCVLKDRNKPIIFTMARLDRVKNITGLVEWYGKNKRLRELVNLVVVAGDRRKESKDLEEQVEMKKMYGLIETYNLNGQFRWISSQMNRVRNGELYRYIADTKGAFVQPVVYEAFGLTVVEAMTYGLPTLLLVMVVQLRLLYMVNQASTLILIMVNKQLSSSLASLRSVRKTLLTGTKSLKED